MAARFPLAVVISAVDRVSGPLGRISGRFGKFGQQLTGVGRNLSLGLTLPTVAFGALTIRTASQFQFAMNRVRALTGATEAEMESLRKKAEELGRDTQFSATEAADAMGNLALAGFETREILASVGPVLNAAAAGQQELADTALVVARALRGYQLEADEAERVADLLAVAATKATQRFDELGEAMQFGGPVAKGFNVPMEDTVALLSRFAQVGFAGSLGGNALARAMSAIAKVKPGTEQAQILERLGVNLKDFLADGGKIPRFLDLLDLLQQRGITAGETFILFQERAAKPLLSLFEEGLGPTRALAEALRDNQGEAARIAAIQMAGAFGATKRLAAAFEGLQISIASSGLLESFTKLVDKLSAWIRKLGETDPKTLQLITKIGLLVAAIGPLLFVLGQGILAFSGLTKGLAIGLTLVGRLAAALKVVLIPAFVRLGAVIAANPIGLIATAISLVIVGVVALKTNFLGLGDAIRKAFSGIVSFFQPVLDVVSFVVEKASALARILDGILPGAGGLLGILGLGAGGGGPGDGGAVPISGRQFQGLPGGLGPEAHLRVDFENVPKGVRVERTDRPSVIGDLDLELNLGYSMNS